MTNKTEKKKDDSAKEPKGAKHKTKAKAKEEVAIVKVEK